ncbi:hypothetical protein [Terrabacter aerolatus]|uniref:PNPLA domain-containing protein n=1 Tax=Terrabacter aerolatus TaxID=422442 RepID=A0A512D035_9MICO|nr:hypothetical protein [Terrabacter aerolatus]GEO29825.1 hypothetical protein TAE01_16350 [Terrabacter aerolatus]
MVRKSIRRALGAGLTSLLVVVGALAGQSPAYAADPDPGVDRVVALLGGSGGAKNLATWTAGLVAVGAPGKPLPYVSARRSRCRAGAPGRSTSRSTASATASACTSTSS